MKIINPKAATAALAMVAALGVNSASAVTIDFNYQFDNGFLSNSASMKSLLNAAGKYIGDRLSDQFTRFNNNVSPFGTSTTLSRANNTVTVFVRGDSSLGGSGTLGVGGSSFSATQPGTVPVDFLPLYGTMSLNSAANWFVDSDPSSLNSGESAALRGKSDLFSVVIHELGHILGVGIAPSWDAKTTNTSAGNLFSGQNSVTAFGGNRPALTSDGGHWQEGVRSFVNGVSQETAMDPSITVGTRKYFTDLDWAALKDIGWQVLPANPAPVPIPAAAWLFGSALLSMGSMARRRHKPMS